MDHDDWVKLLESKYDDLIKEFHQVLQRNGLGQFSINSVEFLDVNRSLFKSITDCPNGIETKCVIKPGGRVECSKVCK
jgi:hypothetical protein